MSSEAKKEKSYNMFREKRSQGETLRADENVVEVAVEVEGSVLAIPLSLARRHAGFVDYARGNKQTTRAAKQLKPD